MIILLLSLRILCITLNSIYWHGMNPLTKFNPSGPVKFLERRISCKECRSLPVVPFEPSDESKGETTIRFRACSEVYRLSLGWWLGVYELTKTLVSGEEGKIKNDSIRIQHIQLGWSEVYL
jgi:hypothetical protein